METITLRDGTFRWTRKALWWTRGLEANQSEIANVVAKTPWHGLSNRVEIDVRGRTYRIGDMIFGDETIEIADELSHAIGKA